MTRLNNNCYITFLLLFFFQFSYYFDTGLGIWTLPSFIKIVFTALLIIHTIVMVFISKQSKSNIRYYFLLIVSCASVLGLLNGAPQSMMTAGLTTGCLMLLGVLMADYDDNYVFKFIILVTIASLVISVYEILHFDTSSTAALVANRGLLWETALFSCGGFFWMYPLLLLYVVIFKKHYAIAIICFVIYATIEIISTKRLFIVETAWIMVLVAYYYFKIGQIKQTRSIIIVFLALIVVFAYIFRNSQIDFAELFESQQARFDEDQIETNGFVRFTESKTVLGNSSPISLFLGHGFGVPISSYNKVATLHVGIANMIYLFGIWMAVPLIMLFFKSLSKITKIKTLYDRDKWRLLCMLVCAVHAPIFLFVGNFWVPDPSTTLFWYCLFRSLFTKPNIEPIVPVNN